MADQGHDKDSDSTGIEPDQDNGPGNDVVAAPATSTPAQRPASAPVRHAGLGTGGVGLPPGVSLTDPWKRFGCYLLEGILALVTLIMGWVIWAAMIAPNGQTPAKKVLGVRVIDAGTLAPVGFGRMFWVRGLLGGMVASLAFTLTLSVLVFMPFWDKRNQTVYEKVSGTLVVDDPSNAWQR